MMHVASHSTRARPRTRPAADRTAQRAGAPRRLRRSALSSSRRYGSCTALNRAKGKGVGGV
eukprot:7372197-Prymnesium_polylepis.1